MWPARVLAAAFIFIGASAAIAQMGSSKYSYIDIEKAAPLVEFENSRLTKISGGVEIVLRAADETVRPMRLEAQDIAFEWAADAESPSTINLNERVRVDSPQGDIRSSRATLDMNGGLLTFTGNVSGSSEQIASFEADQIIYNLDSGDSEMVNLRAKGIGLAGGEGDVSAPDSGYSEMDIDRAGAVKFVDGQVETMSGGVSITLQPAQANAQRLKLGASSVGIAWAPSGQPAAIQMRGSVRVDGPQGDIRSEKADLNLGKKTLEFTGNVKGTTEQIEAFDTDTLTYNLDSGDTLMTNLRAQGLDIGQPEPEAESGEEDSASPFTKMDIEKAPEVSMTAGTLNWMRGGVQIRIHGREEDAPPLTLDANELTFAYSEGAASPDRVVMTGNVIVDGPTMDVTSESAELNMASNTLTFTGNVKGSQPGLTGATARRVVYDLATGNMSMQGTSIEEMDHRRMNEETNKTEEPAPEQ